MSKKVSLIALLLVLLPQPVQAEWNMAGGNPQRTGWVSDDISGVTGIEWYRPIEAFIDQKTQIVTALGNMYVATTKGIIALNAENGQLIWRFDTDLPVGHSPSVVGNTIYVGGYDRKLYALNAQTGQVVWTFTGAKAGYSVNPLVVNNTVYVGSRDGYFYAVNAGNGNLVWQYPAANQDPLGPIMDSAAYSASRNTIYFGSMNMYGYALNASTGQLAWRSEKLPGLSLQSFWPVVTSDRVIFSTNHPFTDGSPGLGSLPVIDNVALENFRDVVFGAGTGNRNSGTVVSSNGSQGWPTGLSLLDTETNPAPGISLQSYFGDRPTWRSTVSVDINTGQVENGLNNPPFVWSGTSSGSRVPPIVDPQTGTIYNSNAWTKAGGNIARQRIMGWRPGNRYLSLPFATHFAIDEPSILSGAGNDILMNLCCDRIAVNLSRGRYYWNYGSMLDSLLPSQNSGGQFTPNIANRYDSMWGLASNNLERLTGYYKGTTTTPNGVYANHGLQTPLVPYRFQNSQGQTLQRIFTHKSNAIIALGPGNSKQYLPPIMIDSQPDVAAIPLPDGELVSRLVRHLDTTLTAREQDPNQRFLNPGYYYPSQGLRGYYFDSPAETLFALSRAYNLLRTRNINPSLQTRLQIYARDYYQQFLANGNIGNTGWQGIPREDILYTPELLADMAGRGPSGANFAPYDVYALSKYAETFPSTPATTLANQIFGRVRNSVSTTLPPPNVSSITDWNMRRPWEVNSYIAGYYGLLRLQELAGNPQSEATFRTQVQNALNTLLAEKSQNFRKDQPIFGDWDNPSGFGGMSINLKVHNFSRNFLYVVPELATHLRNTIPNQVQTAVNEYTYLGPFWFASRIDNDKQERAMHHLYDTPALLSAKAWVLGNTQAELSKFIDVPSFPRGDLFYIHNLVTVLEASTTPQPTPIPPTIRQLLPNWLSALLDQNFDNKVNSLDFGMIIP